MFAIGDSEWPGISKLSEECGEVVQVIAKLMGTRGEREHWNVPDLKVALEDEIADVRAACLFVEEHCGLDIHRIDIRVARKLDLFKQWHRNGDPVIKGGSVPTETETPPPGAQPVEQNISDENASGVHQDPHSPVWNNNGVALPAMPIDKEDERIIDSAMARAQEGRRERKVPRFDTSSTPAKSPYVSTTQATGDISVRVTAYALTPEVKSADTSKSLIDYQRDINEAGGTAGRGGQIDSKSIGPGSTPGQSAKGSPVPTETGPIPQQSTCSARELIFRVLELHFGSQAEALLSELESHASSSLADKWFERYEAEKLAKWDAQNERNETQDACNMRVSEVEEQNHKLSTKLAAWERVVRESCHLLAVLSAVPQELRPELKRENES